MHENKQDEANEESFCKRKQCQFSIVLILIKNNIQRSQVTSAGRGPQS